MSAPFGKPLVVRPSKLDMIVACNAYLQMSAPYEDAPPTQEQLEGHAAHWVALQYGDNPDLVIPVGTMTPQGIAVDLDMQQGAELWRDTVGLFGVAELPIVAQRIHPMACYGTPDRWRWDKIEGILRIWDYKYGHRFVDVFEKFQLIAYAVGILDMLPDARDDETVLVDFKIVQPRSYHRDGPVRQWGPILASDLRALVNVASNAAHAALGENPVATTGAHCLDCEGRHECVALQRAAGGIADYAMTMDRINLAPQALGAELTIVREAIKLLEARDTGLTAQADALIRKGERVPGFGLEPGQSRVKWLEDTMTILAVGDAMGVDLRHPPEPVTPTQAKKMRKVDAAVIDALSSRPTAAMKLVPESTDSTRKLFGASTL